MKNVPHKKVDFFNNELDFSVVYYAGIGLSTSCIKELTNLTKDQIKWRLKCARIKIKDYRNGKTPASKYITRTSRQHLEKYFTKLLS